MSVKEILLLILAIYSLCVFIIILFGSVIELIKIIFDLWKD